jgi:hypothetical protein
VVNIKVDLREIGWSGIEWIDLAQNRNKRKALVNTVNSFEFHKMLEALE